MPVTGRIAGILKAEGNEKVEVVVDVTGIGAGVVDRLREQRELLGRVLAFVAAGKTGAKDKTGELSFVNNRAWAWWTVRELLQDAAPCLVLIDEWVAYVRML